MSNRPVACLWVPYFGVTVAQRAGRRLAGPPLVLLDEHDRVLATDAPAAQAGILPGMAARQAAARCPAAQLAPANLYPLWEAQEAFYERIKPYTALWQPAGLGCVYLDAPLTGPANPPAGSELLRWCQALAGAVRRLAWGEPALGVTASKFGADVARQVAGANMALLVGPLAQPSFLAAQPVALLPLADDALLQLRHLGIRTLGQFTRLPPAGILARFGPVGRTAQRWALGHDDRPVVPPWQAPEVATRIEFETPLADRTRLLYALGQRAERLLRPLQDRLQAAGRITLLVTRADGRSVPAGHIFPMPTAALEPVRLGLAAALDRVTWDGQPAAEILLTLAGITDTPGRQLPLFDFDGANRARLAATLQNLAARFSPDAFRLATLHDPDNLLPERRAGWQAFGT